MRPDIEYAVEILSKLASATDEERLAYGQVMRQEISDMLKRGQTPAGYRWDWLVASSKQLMELLQMMADDFNKAHPHDMASTLDILDILAMTTSNIKQIVVQQNKNKGEEGE